MRKFLIIICSIILVFESCGGKKNTFGPKETFVEFIKALKRNDFSNAEDLATPNSAKTFLFLNYGLGKEQIQRFLNKIDTSNLSIEEPKIAGDTATLVLKASVISAKFMLQKISNEWKVAFDEDGILNMVSNTGISLVGNDSEPQLNMDSLKKVLNQQAKELNIDPDSFDAEMRNMDLKEMEKMLIGPK